MDIFVAEKIQQLLSKCPLCNKKIKNQWILYQHMKRCKESYYLPPEFMCGFCPYQTGLKSKLLNHISYNHDTNITPPLRFYRLKFQFSTSGSD